MAGFWSWLNYWQTLIAGAFARDGWLDHWQPLLAGMIGGVLTLAAGIFAYVGARSAAKRQIDALAFAGARYSHWGFRRAFAITNTP